MAPFPVLVHPFPSPTEASCAYEYPCGQEDVENAIVFINGLGGGPHGIPYVKRLAERLQAVPKLSYSVFEFRMNSSFRGYGTSSLREDAENIASLVKYLRELGRQKIILLGHSTGCQDCVEYAKFSKTGGGLPVDGFILQGPVSDREALELKMDADLLRQSLEIAADMIAGSREKDIMPWSATRQGWTTPITAYRWHSLYGRGGDDDFFSSDLTDEEVEAVWSRFDKPVLILYSGEEEYAPKGVDTAALVDRWLSFCPPGVGSKLSGLIPGANHAVDAPDAQEWLCDRVIAFLNEC